MRQKGGTCGGDFFNEAPTMQSECILGSRTGDTVLNGMMGDTQISDASRESSYLQQVCTGSGDCCASDGNIPVGREYTVGGARVVKRAGSGSMLRVKKNKNKKYCCSYCKKKSCSCCRKKSCRKKCPRKCPKKCTKRARRTKSVAHVKHVGGTKRKRIGGKRTKYARRQRRTTRARMKNGM